MLKKRYLLLILIVSLFALSAVSAVDNDDVVMSNDYDSGLIAESLDTNVSYGTFQELQGEIDAVEVGGTLNLTRNYKYVDGSNEGIWINKHITINGQGYTIDGNGQSRIFYIWGSNVILKNLTLINGNANNGGGIIWHASNGTIKYVKFYNNNALKEGGAVYISTNFLKIQFCNFTNNKAYDGGAVYSYDANLNISNSYFESNSVLSDGGAIGYSDGKSNIVNSTFRNNLADTGGALYWYDTQVTILNSTFYKNFAWERGGAIHCRGYNSKILNSDFINNTGEVAGAISLDSPNCLVNSSKFINNSVSRYGGAFWWYGINGIINNSYFENNMASESGKSIYWSGGNGTIMNSFFNKKKTIYTRNDVKLINLTEIGLPVKLNVNNIEKYYDYENIKIIAKLTDDDLNPLSSETIKLEINNVTYSRSTNKTGHALFSIKLDAGFYNVTTYLQNSAEYEDCIVNSTVLIKSTIISSDVYNDTKFSVKLLDSFGNNLTNVGINFYVDGNYYTSGITDDNGNIEINFYLPEGKYLIECKNTFTLEKKANYIQIFNKTIILANNVVKYFGGNERFNIEIFKNDKTPIDNAKIKILINGQPYTRTTDNNGKASMAINLDSGVYNVTTDYGGLKVYSTVTVKSTISANDFTKIFRNATQYYGTFVDSQGNLLKNTKVIFNINGVFYERTTNDNGIAKLNINLNPGTYILTATNLVNGENHATTITVLPNIIENHDLTKYYKNASQYVIKVLDDQGNPVSGQSVDFNINGVFYTRTSNATGHVKMNINLNPGTYIITAIYKGFMTSNTITVKTVLEAKDLNMKFRDGSKFEAKLLDGEGNPFASRVVTFNINGVLYERMTDIGGIARLNINLNPGSYIITSSYNGLNIANTIRIALDPIYYTIGSNPLDYNYYMNEYNRFTWDWYYSPQHEAMVRTIYDIYGNQGMEIQDQYVHYGTKYYCWDQSNRLDYRLNKDGEVISVTNMMDYYVDYKEYDYNNNELIYHNVYLPDYDAETTAEVEGYDVTVHQWRTPNFSEIDVIVRDKNGNMLDLYSYDTMILTDGTWYGPYDQVANAERSTYHKWHKSPNSRTTEVAVKIKAYVNLI